MKKKIIFILMLIAFIPGLLVSRAMAFNKSDWALAIGPFISYLPRYSGASEYKFLPTPYAYFKWKNRIEFNTIDGLGFDFYNNGKGTTLGAGFGYSLGRSRHETALVEPFGTIAYYATVKAYATYMKGPFELNGTIDRAIMHGYQYVTVTAGTNVYYPWRENCIFKFGPTIYWGNESFMNGYYGVTASQAASEPGIREHHMSSGFDKVKLDLEAFITFRKNWIINPAIDYLYLFDKPAQSDVVKARSEFAAGLVVAYKII